MKKLLIVTLIAALILPALAVADLPDISGLSYNELVQLKDKINLAMWNSQEWQEVEVPTGIWEIGADIPAGHWTVTPKDCIISFWYGDKLNDTKTDVGKGWDYNKGVAITLNGRVNKDGSWKYPDDQHSVSIEMQEGMYIKTNGPVIFTPYTGKPSLGFK